MTLSEISVLDKNYYKTNYLDALRILIPNVYEEEDFNLSGTYTDPIFQVLNSHLEIANSISSLLYISGVDVLSSIAGYFVKQNALTLISPYLFEKYILVPLGKSFASFDTSGEFKDFIDNTFIPSFRVNNPSAGVFETTPGDTHTYLINHLSWFYFLNTSGNGNLLYDCSSYISDKYVHELWKGKTLGLADGLKGLNRFLWNNVGVSSTFSSFIPYNYTSAVNTSGLTQLDTIVDVLYNNLIVDRSDTTVKDAFQNYIDLGVSATKDRSQGPFFRFLEAASLALYDVNAAVEEINTNLDIESAPPELLPYIAELIGWKLRTHDSDKWRVQLRKAVEIYKAKGTKKGLRIAINTVVPSSIFNPISGITELHESYIPYLIYYSLLTESDLFASGFNSWTPEVAANLGVSDYTTTSFDTNIRFAVDTIIYYLVKAFPEEFKIGSRLFDLDNSEFVYKYRGRVFPIPPWEEFKYYARVRLSARLLDELKELLACFGVDSSFALSVVKYIKQYTTETINSDITTIGNAWLFFTPSSVDAPNFNTIISNTVNNRSQYLSLWNGKSSHFRVAFNVSDYNFSSTSYDNESYLSIITNARFINEFSPFHSIPETLLFMDEYEETETYYDNSSIILFYDKLDYASSSSAYAGYASSGITLSSYGDGFSREAAATLLSYYDGASSFVANIPRVSTKRRNYFNVLSRADLYTRTGFNMPSEYVNYTSAGGGWASYVSSYLPLGYVPSAGVYAPIDDYKSVSSVWHKCVNLTSPSSFSGVDASNTYPCRGLSAMTASSTNTYVARACPPIISVMWRRMQQNAYEDASAIPEYFDNGKAVALSSDFMDIQRSNANTSAGPSSFDDYLNFEFGREIFRLYDDYTTYYGKVGNKNNIENSNGTSFDFFSHMCGPLVYNGTFKVDGSSIGNNGQYTGSSIFDSPEISFMEGSGLLSASSTALASGTYVVSTIGTDFYIQLPEFRNPHFISGIELVSVSGSSRNNKFQLFKVDSSFSRLNSDNYMISKRLIKASAYDKFDRVRISVNDYGGFTNGLLPDHLFSFTVRVLPGNVRTKTYGGSVLGIWIHTKPESNKFWCFVPGINFPGRCGSVRNKWLQFDPSRMRLRYVLDNLCHLYKFDPEPKIVAHRCYTEQGDDQFGGLLITEDKFKEVTLNFDTINRNVELPGVYQKSNGLLHRLDQDYVIEFFMLRDRNVDTFQVYDGISIKDETHRQRAYRFSYEDIFDIFKFFNEVANGVQSKNPDVMESINGYQGGHRLDYRDHPAWSGGVLRAADNLEWKQVGGTITVDN